MAPFRQYIFTQSSVRSLCWRDDELVDWVSGGRAFALDGTEQIAKIMYADRFDSATASPDGRFAVIYERLGTKGLLVDDGKIVRELDRSRYKADAYEYPIALFNGPNGRLLLAHCPKEHGRIELEEVETGRPLTASPERKPPDFFHSRLAASPQGKRLLSAGWVWHPWGSVICFDLARGLADVCHFDHNDTVAAYSRHVGLAEEDSACWLDDDRILIGASGEPEDPEESRETEAGLRLLPRGLAVYDLAHNKCLQAFQLDEPPGTLFALGSQHVLSLYRHPKLIDVSTGQVLHVWKELDSGFQDSSIIWGLKEHKKPPPMAFDPTRNRFAIANGDTVTIIEFDVPALGSAKSGPESKIGYPA